MLSKLDVDNLPPLPPKVIANTEEELSLDDFFIIESVPGKHGLVQVSTLSPTLVASAAVVHFQPVTYLRTLYIYNRETGLYRADSGEVEEWCTKILNRIYLDREKYCLKVGFHKAPFVEEVYKEVCRSHVLSVDRCPFDNYPGFPANNCVIVIDLETGTLSTKNYEPSMLFTRKSPVDYDPLVSSGNTLEILQKWLSGINSKSQDLWEYLVQIPAQAILQSLPGFSPFKQAYLLLGEHDSGKSTYNLAIQGLFGSSCVTTKSLQTFNGRYDLGDLVKIMVNFGDDLTSFEISDGNQFKSMIGIDEITVEHKYRQSYKARIYAVHVYSANIPPTLFPSLYQDEAWWSRWQIISFRKHFERNPSWSKKHLTTSFFQGFLLLVLAEILKIIRNGMKLPLTQEIDEVRSLWTADHSLFHKFFLMTFDSDEKEMVSYQAMMHSLRSWADQYMPVPSWVQQNPDSIHAFRYENKLKLPLSSTQSLTKALEREGISHTNTTHNSVTARYYTGIKYKDVPWKP